MNSLNNIKTEAIDLRKKGKSYGEIQKKLGVPKSTLTYWLKGIPLSKQDRKRLYTARLKNMIFGPGSIKERRKREIEQIIDSAKREISSPLPPEIHRLFGAALYWAEGTKDGAIQITNSDPLLILYMVRWIEHTFAISPKGLKAWLNIYPHQNDPELKQFRSSLSGIPVSNFGKSFVKPTSKGVKRNNLYYGTIKIRVPKSTDLKHKVFGWIQGALKEYQIESKVVERKWIRLRIEKPLNLD